MPDLLLELFSEEIPARMQGKAADDLKKLQAGGFYGAQGLKVSVLNMEGGSRGAAARARSGSARGSAHR